MPSSPQDRVRRQVSSRLLPQLMLLLYRADKGSEQARLEDLRSDAARAVYLRAALNLFEPTVQRERMRRVHELDAHQFAAKDIEEQDVIRQAREDIARYGDPLISHFGDVRPGCCWLCKERITPSDAFVLHLTATSKADVHGRCCQDDPRFELMSAFSFRLLDGGRQ